MCIGRDLIDDRAYGFHNASLYTKEERLPMTKLVEILHTANNTAFTVNFNCKVQEKDIGERLATVTAAEKGGKALAKELLQGREVTVVGRLSSSENNLGRSGVVVFAGSQSPYVQVDHRGINWIILKGVKYIHS